MRAVYADPLRIGETARAIPSHLVRKLSLDVPSRDSFALNALAMAAQPCALRHTRVPMRDVLPKIIEAAGRRKTGHSKETLATCYLGS